MIFLSVDTFPNLISFDVLSWWSSSSSLSGNICSIIKKTNKPIKVQRPIFNDDACGCENASGNKWRNTSPNWLPTATLNNNSK